MYRAIEFGGDAAIPAEDEVLTAAILAAGLPQAARRHLRLAAQSSSTGEIEEAHLWSAYAAAPANPAVLIGLYRFYFYKNRLAEALEVARFGLEKAAQHNALPPDWRDVRSVDAAFGDFWAILPRLYLFTLKAYAYLHMRLGNLAEGRAIVTKLLDLDPTDKIGAKVLLGILDRKGLDDDG